MEAWIDTLAGRAIDPARTRSALDLLSQRWPAAFPPLPALLEASPGLPDALAHLLSVSPISGEKILADPEALLWLSRPDVHRQDRGPRRLQADYEQLLELSTPGFDAGFRALRRWKARQMLRIALREVAGWSEMEETTLELTGVAEFAVQTVSQGWLEELARKLGRPGTEFAVLGMGKFGGQELNYSSDIDVLFFYGEEGQLSARLSYHDFFTRLAEKIVATFSAPDAAGALFRIDLRLRPEGACGPLVRSLDGLENYYAAFGETWERMALIKARVVGGSRGVAELEYEFGRRLQAFIYPRTSSLEILEEIHALKSRIEREMVGAADLHRNVKLGFGGIREIEFVTQTLQILHGARHAFLQERATLRALRNLRELDLLPGEDVAALNGAYRWLRTVEHRLQIEHEAQTHTLSTQPEALGRLAASLGFADAGRFEEELSRQTGAVRRIFEQVLGASRPEAVPAPPDLEFFAQPAQARRALEELAGAPRTRRGPAFSPRTQKLFGHLQPALLDGLRRVADPDLALTGFVRFVERYGIRGLLFETLLVNPQVLDVLLRLFDASRAMTEIILRRPQLLEDLARHGDLGQPLTVAAHLDGLARNEENLSWPDAARLYRRSQFLRIGLRDLLGLAKLREIQEEYSALAEACVLYTQGRLGLEKALTVVALGKLGGRELSYGADLDLLFVGENPAAAAEIVRSMSATTAEGRLFAVDTRLRPEGEAGALAVSLPTYRAYFEKRAQLWEAQALTKARPISGPLKGEFLAVAQGIWRRFGAREGLFEEIAAMHARIVRERSGPDAAFDFKTGPGGLMQAEFFIQGRQMRAGLWATNTFQAMEVLERAGEGDGESWRKIAEDYGFLRLIESVLRRVDDSRVTQLPKGPVEQRRLAWRCGYGSGEALRARYLGVRQSWERLGAPPMD